MTDDRDHTTGHPAAADPVTTGGDYSYDLAHEAVGAARDRPASSAEPERAAGAASDATDSGGDYSYDLAHEVPRPGE